MAREPTWITGVACLIGASPLVGRGRALPGGWDAWGRRDAVPLQERLSLAIQWDHHAPRALLPCRAWGGACSGPFPRAPLHVLAVCDQRWGMLAGSNEAPVAGWRCWIESAAFWARAA